MTEERNSDNQKYEPDHNEEDDINMTIRSNTRKRARRSDINDMSSSENGLSPETTRSRVRNKHGSSGIENITIPPATTCRYNHPHRPREAPSARRSSGRAPVKHLKLLRPDDTLHIGHVYRLVSFEEVLREFASKKQVRLSKLLVAQKERSASSQRGRGGEQSSSSSDEVVEEQMEPAVENCSRRSGAASRSGQWRPALHSIAEIGS
ncbi:uncharacterized protein LOC109820999 [Asparagus officinalis]|uniref:uncharacterized protein LOC109820999 n=1 Tax=Asparagus officinalis TaxID=4686 RepID=UPI00098E0B38|nr:uncharacterized protein LOC109820999 [Asparagus officinalis]